MAGNGNYVAISVKAQDEAKPDLDALKAKLEELNRQVAEARADVDTADADAKLTDLQARLDAVSKKVASPRIDMAGAARALAQLTAVDAAMGHLGDEGGDGGRRWGEGFRDAARGPLNDLSGHLGGSGIGKDAESAGREDGGLFGNSFVQTFLGGKKTAIVGGIASALAAVPALGAVAGVGMVAALGGVVADKIPAVGKEFKSLGTSVMGTLETAVKPLVPFLTSAAGQIGAIMKQVGPELAGLFKNVGPMIAPLVSGLGGLVRGLLPGLGAILRSAMPAVQAFGSALATLGKDLGGMFSAMAPAVKASAGVMKALLDVVSGLFPVIGKLGAIMATALAPVLGQVMIAVRALEPAFSAVAKVVAAFAQAFLGNLQGGLSAVIGLVTKLAPVVTKLAGVFLSAFNLMNNRGIFNDIEDAIEGLVGPIASIVTALATALMPIIPPILNVLSALAGVVQGVLISAVTALAPILVTVAKLLGQLLRQAVLPLLPIIVQLATMLGGFLGRALAQLLPPVGQLVEALLKILIAVTPLLPPVLQLAEILISLALKALTPVIKLVSLAAGWLADLAKVIADVVGWVARIVAAGLRWAENLGRVRGAVAGVFDWIKGHWPLLVGIFLGPMALVVVEVVKHFSQIKSGAADMFRDVVSFFRTLPGRILSALGDLGSILFNAGRKIIGGLLNGIKSMVGDVGSAIGGVVDEVKSFLPFSPAKKGPLSGSGSPDRSGLSVARMFAQGIMAGAPDAQRAMARLAGGAALSGRPAMAGGYGGAQLNATLRIEGGDGPLTTAIGNAMRLYVRERGGGGTDSVQKALGRKW